jgi:hypothetical protein
MRPAIHLRASTYRSFYAYRVYPIRCRIYGVHRSTASIHVSPSARNSTQLSTHQQDRMLSSKARTIWGTPPWEVIPVGVIFSNLVFLPVQDLFNHNLHPSMHLLINVPIHAPMYPYIHLGFNIWAPTCLNYIHLCIYWSMYLSTRQCIHIST